MFAFLSSMEVDGHTISPGYDYDAAKKDMVSRLGKDPEDFFLTRRMTREKFARIEEWGRKYRILGTPVYLEFLAGKRDLTCTAWAIPTRNIAGWKAPCYLMTDGHYPTYREMLEKVDWDAYGVVDGVARDSRCENCMVHCGYDPSGALGTDPRPGDTWKQIKSTSAPAPALPPGSPGGRLQRPLGRQGAPVQEGSRPRSPAEQVLTRPRSPLADARLRIASCRAGPGGKDPLSALLHAPRRKADTINGVSRAGTDPLPSSCRSGGIAAKPIAQRPGILIRQRLETASAASFGTCPAEGLAGGRRPRSSGPAPPRGRPGAAGPPVLRQEPHGHRSGRRICNREHADPRLSEKLRAGLPSPGACRCVKVRRKLEHRFRRTVGWEPRGGRQPTEPEHRLHRRQNLPSSQTAAERNAPLPISQQPLQAAPPAACAWRRASARPPEGPS